MVAAGCEVVGSDEEGRFGLVLLNQPEEVWGWDSGFRHLWQKVGPR